MRKRSKGSFADLKRTRPFREQLDSFTGPNLYILRFDTERGLKYFLLSFKLLEDIRKKYISLPFIIYKRFLYKENILFYSNLYIKIIN